MWRIGHKSIHERGSMSNLFTLLYILCGCNVVLVERRREGACYLRWKNWSCCPHIPNSDHHITLLVHLGIAIWTCVFEFHYHLEPRCYAGTLNVRGIQIHGLHFFCMMLYCSNKNIPIWSHIFDETQHWMHKSLLYNAQHNVYKFIQHVLVFISTLT